jgi:hypothetical protein
LRLLKAVIFASTATEDRFRVARRLWACSSIPRDNLIWRWEDGQDRIRVIRQNRTCVVRREVIVGEERWGEWIVLERGTEAKTGQEVNRNGFGSTSLAESRCDEDKVGSDWNDTANGRATNETGENCKSRSKQPPPVPVTLPFSCYTQCT